MANYYAGDPTVLWIVILGFIISFVLAMGLGANDVANSFGTSVGAKVLTLYQACVVAAIFETAGAILLGYRVSDTIRKGIFDPLLYNGREELLLVGNLCALAGSCIWLFTATIFSVPVSATHSIVGASLGFHMVVFGGVGVNWNVVVVIVISWFLSPVFSGIISSCIYGLLYFTVLKRDNPLDWGIYTVPVWYFILIFVNFFSIFYGSSILFGFDEIWIVMVISIGSGLVIAGFGYFFIIPWIKNRVTKMKEQEKLELAEEGQSRNDQEQETELKGLPNGNCDGDAASLEKKNPDDPDAILVPEHPIASGLSAEFTNGMAKPAYTSSETVEMDINSEDEDSSDKWLVKKGSKEWESVKDSIEVRAICSPLQVVSACFAAFTHGGNDVSNAIGPLISIWTIFTTGSVDQETLTPVWILFYGGAGISLGLFLLGRRVIKTIGEDLTPMTPSNGFCVELGSASTVLLASNLGIPISTTHCQVGSVCGVGWLRTRKAVDWPLFSGIFFAWVVTLPATMMLSSGLMGFLQHAVPGSCELIPIPVMNTTTTAMASTLGLI
ncbi:sodium-dependent phosphate transporter 2-like [Lytechinus variegatus]|uniref:sodium-dependent phosphate transporter 2-like n=1 Tax=Lytechinus variegatus TaxID=7654 RepID=UPI001BB24A73|nr:sodium-dependent phosphate transporter 2-like [Lytechinus variegatus]